MLPSRISQQWTTLPTLPTHASLPQLVFYQCTCAYAILWRHKGRETSRLHGALAPSRNWVKSRAFFNVSWTYGKPLCTEGPFPVWILIPLRNSQKYWPCKTQWDQMPIKSGMTIFKIFLILAINPDRINAVLSVLNVSLASATVQCEIVTNNHTHKNNCSK